MPRKPQPPGGRQPGKHISPAAFKKAHGFSAFQKRPGDSWSDTRNRGARALGYKDYTDYRLHQGLRAGKTIQQSRGHASTQLRKAPGTHKRPEKVATTFRPGKRAAKIFTPRFRVATTTATPAYFFDLSPYPKRTRGLLVDTIIGAARRRAKKHGGVAYRFFYYGSHYAGLESASPHFYYGDTNLLVTKSDWHDFRTDLTVGIEGVLGDPIVGVWLYGVTGRRG